MTTEAIKATAITNMDALPPSRATTGEGAPGVVRHVDAVAAVADAKTSGSTYKMARVPSNAKIKHLRCCMDAAVTTFTVDIGASYSDSTYDGTPAGLVGTVIDADFFGSAVALAAIVTPTDYVNESATNTGAKRMQPLWQALGLTLDPMCYIDIVLTNTATNSTAGTVYTEVEYVI